MPRNPQEPTKEVGRQKVHERQRRKFLIGDAISVVKQKLSQKIWEKSETVNNFRELKKWLAVHFPDRQDVSVNRGSRLCL